MYREKHKNIGKRGKTLEKMGKQGKTKRKILANWGIQQKKKGQTENNMGNFLKSILYLGLIVEYYVVYTDPGTTI